MKKDFLFILLIVGVIFAVSVYAWPNYYPNQLINSQGYLMNNETNATWEPVTIIPMYGWQTTYQNGTWIGNYLVNYEISTNTIMFAAYGCCNLDNESIWYGSYSCNSTVGQRYREETIRDWSCGWNIAFS